VGEAELKGLGFVACAVVARRLDIDHHDPAGRGPFCRLDVEDHAPERPGVYAWAVDGQVLYVGKARELRQIVHGTRMGRAYNDYTYMPPSKVWQTSSPRVRVNGLLNRALCAGSVVRWWWRESSDEQAALALEAEVIHLWSPAWNRATPSQM
jgi:hypothetical protein